MPDTLPTPRTYDNPDVNFFHDGMNNGFLGDYVQTADGRRGRIYDAHFACPEDDAWLAGQLLLGPDPTVWKRCRWVSILVHESGAVVVPEQFVTVVEPFEFDNRSSKMYFRD